MGWEYAFSNPSQFYCSQSIYSLVGEIHPPKKDYPKITTNCSPQKIQDPHTQAQFLLHKSIIRVSWLVQLQTRNTKSNCKILYPKFHMKIMKTHKIQIIC